ncbi:hypothetical protein CI238_04267, partial [Colletotrichum incanum]
NSGPSRATKLRRLRLRRVNHPRRARLMRRKALCNHQGAHAYNMIASWLGNSSLACTAPKTNEPGFSGVPPFALLSSNGDERRPTLFAVFVSNAYLTPSYLVRTTKPLRGSDNRD